MIVINMRSAIATMYSSIVECEIIMSVSIRNCIGRSAPFSRVYFGRRQIHKESYSQKNLQDSRFL